MWVTRGRTRARSLHPDRFVPSIVHHRGLFAQDDLNVPWLTLSARPRRFPQRGGAFFSPRLSALARSGVWTTRPSVGRGFSAATPLTEETSGRSCAVGLAAPLEAERGTSASLDVTHAAGALSVTGMLFASRIADPVDVDRDDYVISNLDEATTNVGAELLGTFRRPPFALTRTTPTCAHERPSLRAGSTRRSHLATARDSSPWWNRKTLAAWGSRFATPAVSGSM